MSSSDAARPFHALVPAAGRGERFGGDTPKQFVVVAGKPLLAWTVERLLAAGAASVTVALPASVGDAAEHLPHDPRLRLVAGGSTRQESVAACLAGSPSTDDDLVAVHDGARPAVAVTDLVATVQAAEAADGAVLGRPVGDTLKRVETGAVRETVDRSGLFRAETPQVFRRRILASALERAEVDGFEATDEAALVERLGGRRIVAVIASSPNPKLTHAADLPLLEALLAPPGRL